MSCKKQEEINIPLNEKISAKKFDFKRFQKNIKLKRIIKDGQFINVRESEFIDGDSIYKCEEGEKNFYEEIKKVGEKFKKVSNYNRATLLALNNGTYFYNFPIGITKSYNNKGQIVKEINNDRNYPFSIYDLLIKIKKTHNIDLNIGTEVRSVDRYFDASFNKFIYLIYYKNNGDNQVKSIVVDAKTGVILKESVVTIIK